MQVLTRRRPRIRQTGAQQRASNTGEAPFFAILQILCGSYPDPLSTWLRAGPVHKHGGAARQLHAARCRAAG
jgi:hypothetical protein